MNTHADFLSDSYQPPSKSNTFQGECKTCGNTKLMECTCTEGLGTDNAYVDCYSCGGSGTIVCQNCDENLNI